MAQLKLISSDINITKNEDNTIINIKDSSNIIFELNGNTIFKSKGKLFFVSEDEIGMISKKGINLESIENSNIHLNSRRCSLIKDDPQSIKDRIEMEFERNKQLLFSEQQKQFITSLKDRVSRVEEHLKIIDI